jgi:hypothetical protein
MPKEITLDKETVEAIIEGLTDFNELNLLEFTDESFNFGVEDRLTYARSYAKTIAIICYLKELLKENENTNHQVS